MGRGIEKQRRAVRLSSAFGPSGIIGFREIRTRKMVFGQSAVSISTTQH